jgi:hypothetical protein
MFGYGDRLVICKGFFGFRRFYKTLRVHERENPKATFIIHCRIGTSGRKDAANCHPFLTSQGYGFAHNGVMFGLGNAEYSDTYEFVKKTLSKLPPFWERQDILVAIEKCATASSSKYVMLNGQGHYIIFNEGAGFWEDGRWFSNSSYKFTSVRNSKAKNQCNQMPHSRPAFLSHEPDDPFTGLAAADNKWQHCIMCGQYSLAKRRVNVGASDYVCFGCWKELVEYVYISCPDCFTYQSIISSSDLTDGMVCDICQCEIEAIDVMIQVLSYVRG